MAITSTDTLNTALANTQTLVISKASIATQGAGGYTSLWRATGIPDQGAIPAGAATPTKATTGSWNFTNPGSGLSYLTQLTISGSISHELYIVDRLSHMGGLNGTTTGDQTVGISVPASRNATAGAADLTWWLEIYTDIGTSPVSGTLTYVDTADQTRTVAVAVGGASPLNQDSRCFPIVPNAGQPIKSITKFQHATTGAAGSYGFTLTKTLACVNMGQIYSGMTYDYAQLGLPVVANDACLAFIVLSSTTSSGVITGSLKMGNA